MTQYQKNNDVLNTVNRGNPAESGICTLCRADCRGKCETWTSRMKGRKLISKRFWNCNSWKFKYKSCWCMLQ